MGGLFRPTLALGILTSALLLPAPALAGETIAYGYDQKGRLKSVDRSGTVNNGVSALYSYDKADNRTNVTVSTGGSSMMAGGMESFAPSSSTADEGLAEGPDPMSDDDLALSVQGLENDNGVGLSCPNCSPATTPQ